MRKRFLAIFCLLAAWPALIQAQSTGAVSAPPPVALGVKADKAVDARRETFEVVWRTVNEKHFDPNFGGVDWAQVREKYAPLVSGVKSDPELYRLLQKMLGELHQSHFNIIPPESVIPDESSEAPLGGIGIDLRLIDGQAIVTRVEQGSAAARTELRPGYIIKLIGEKKVDEIIAPVNQRDEPPAIKAVRMTRLLMAAIGGQPESSVSLKYLTDQGELRTAMMTRERLKGDLSPRFGNFPPQYTEFEARRLSGNLGYIRFNIFTIPVMEKVRTAIKDLGGLNSSENRVAGLIFDLRGNPGGVGGIASGIAGLLAAQQGSLGTMKMRSTQMNFTFFPQAQTYSGPVVILIDGLSGSTSEVFAGGMQEIGRAVVIGERSMGAALPSFFQKLPTGALFQFAIADFKTPKGILIEGRGVFPNLEIKWNRVELLAGRDPQLNAAIEYLQGKSKAVQKKS
jgi:carboxyl-terminal processing protease